MGKSQNKKYYDYIKSYSPYDNVKKQTYPNLLVTSGLHDSQVQYWEPAKWVASLGLNLLIKIKFFYTQIWKLDMEELQGRFNSLKETSKKYAFI